MLAPAAVARGAASCTISSHVFLAGVLTVPLWGPYSDARISCIIMVYSAVCRILPFLDSILPRYYFGGIIHRWVSNGLTRLESH